MHFIYRSFFRLTFRVNNEEFMPFYRSKLNKKDTDCKHFCTLIES